MTHLSNISAKIGKVATASALVVIASVTSYTSPQTAFARDTSTATSKIQAQADARGFCTQLTTVSTHIEELIDQRNDTIEKSRDTLAQKLHVSEAGRDQKLAELRAKWDKNRALQYEKLHQRATTQAEHNAVDAFQATLDSAVAKRRASVDAAVATFRTTVATELSSRSGGIDTSIVNYQTAITQANAHAQASCAAGTDPVTVRTTYRDELSIARSNLQSAGSDTDKVATAISTAAKTRRDAITTAVNEFKSIASQARKTLESVFK